MISRHSDYLNSDILLLSNENDYFFSSRLKRFLEDKNIKASILDFAESTALRYSFYRKKDDFISIIEPLSMAYSRMKNTSKYAAEAERYLMQFEHTYMHDKTVNQLLMTSPFYQSSHHYRFPYYNEGSVEERNIMAWSLIQWSENLLKNTSAKLIFTTNCNYLLKQVFFRIAKKLGIQVRILCSTRIDSYVTFLDEDQKPVFNALKSNLGDYSSGALTDTHHSTYKGPHTLMSTIRSIKQYSLGMASNTFNLTLITILKEIKHFFVFYNGNLIQYVIDQFKPFEANFFLTLSFFSKLIFNYLLVGLGIRTYNKLSLNQYSVDYVLMTLHVLPESSTLCWSNHYYELDLIREISANLPISHKLYVKEHLQMIGDRPKNFYDQLKTLPNVRLVSPLEDIKELIKNSSCVIGISGTSCLEAAIANKNVCIIGEPEFSTICDPRYKGIPGLYNILRDLRTTDFPLSIHQSKHLSILMNKYFSMNLRLSNKYLYSLNSSHCSSTLFHEDSNLMNYLYNNLIKELV